MRHSLALILFVGGLCGCLFLLGCSGSSGVTGAKEGMFSVTSMVVSGPANGPAAFSLALRAEGEETQATTQKYQGRLLVNGIPLAQAETLPIDGAQNRLTFSAMASVIPGPLEFALDLRPASATVQTSPLFKGYFRFTVADGAVTSATVTLDASATARALAYESWKRRAGAEKKTIDDFTGDVSILGGLVQSQLNSQLASTTPPGPDFSWGKPVTQEASRVADLAPIPGIEGNGALDLATGSLELHFNWEWPVTTGPDSVRSTPGEIIGLTYFKLPTNNQPTLGNYFAHYHPGTSADPTTVIAWIPAATSLDDVASAPSSYVTQALDRFPLPTEMIVGQVYGFRVGETYGALQITQFSLGTSVTFRYKYNRRAGDPTLR